MPITDPPKSDYQYIARRAVKFLGIASPNDATGDAISPHAPYTDEMIEQGIIQADYEVCALIAGAESHSYRSAFFTETPNAINDGDRIPGYIGIHGKVEVETEINKFVKGRLAQSFSHLERVRDFPLLYSPGASNLYFIDNGVIHAANGLRAKVYVPTIPQAVKNLGTINLHSPKIYQNAVLAHTIANLRMVGSDTAHRNDWTGIWAAYAALIMNNAGSLPEPEKLQRNSE